jgi:hypothetical protein
MSTMDLSLIAKAAELANRAHCTCGQTRKGTGLPYILHPVRVAALVEAAGGDSVQIAAAWCHDVLEDCPAFREEAARLLPEPVLALVRELTKAEVSPGKQVKGEAFLAELRAMSPAAKLVKLCDRLDNLRDAPNVGDPIWVRRYCGETSQALYALETNPATGPDADRLVTQIREQMQANYAWAESIDGIGADGLTEGDRANLASDERMAARAARDPGERRRRQRERRQAERDAIPAFVAAMALVQRTPDTPEKRALFERWADASRRNAESRRAARQRCTTSGETP